MKKIIYILIAFVFFSCNQDKETSVSETTLEENSIVLNKVQLSNINIQLGNIGKQKIGNIIKANGKVDVPPRSLVDISAVMGGYLKSTKLLPGQRVRASEVLAIIENQEFIELQKNYLSAKAKFSAMKIDFEKQKELYEQKAISEKQYLETSSNFEQLKIDIKSLEEKLKLIGINTKNLNVESISASVTIKSPIDGYVSKVNTNIGKFVNASDVLFELINPNDIHLNIQIYEKDIAALSIGQKVYCYSNDNPDKKYKAEIILIGRDINENKAVDVHCHFESDHSNILPGMFMNVEIESKLTEAYAIPTEAIQKFENKDFIVIAENDSTFSLKQVQIGNKENGYTELLNINQDVLSKQVVIKDAYQILMAMKNKAEEE